MCIGISLTIDGRIIICIHSRGRIRITISRINRNPNSISIRVRVRIVVCHTIHRNLRSVIRLRLSLSFVSSFIHKFINTH